MVEKDARDTLGDLVFRTMVPRNVRVSEAPSYAMPVVEYDPMSKGSIAYRALAQENGISGFKKPQYEVEMAEPRAERRGLGRGLSALMADVGSSTADVESQAATEGRRPADPNCADREATSEPRPAHDVASMVRRWPSSPKALLPAASSSRLSCERTPISPTTSRFGGR